MTITFHTYCWYRKQGGERTLFVRVTFRKQSRKIATTITVTQADLTRTGKVKSPAILNKYEDLVRQMRDAVSDLNAFALDAMTVDDVVRHIRKRMEGAAFRLDFIAFGREAARKRSPGTAKNYDYCLDALDAFAKARGFASLDINDITKALLLDFREWCGTDLPKLRKHGRPGPDAATRYLAKLATIHREAKEFYNDEDAGVINIPRSPFQGLKLTAPLEGRQVQENLGVEVMQRIISARPADIGQQMTLAAFVVSFGMMGMNAADLFEARTPVAGVVTYNRRKTRKRRSDAALMKVRVDDRLSYHVGLLSSWRGTHWLDQLNKWARGKSSREGMNARLNRHLRQWCKTQGLPAFTFYAARKSWASIARNNAGVDKATVDECLCHRGDLRLADIYIEKDWSLLWRANAKVLDLFAW